MKLSIDTTNLFRELSQEVEASVSGGTATLNAANVRAVAAKASGNCHSGTKLTAKLGFSIR